MVVKPIFRGFICTTSHPEGCAINVRNQVEYVKNRKISNGPKKVLVIGASTGYGLASRITAAFGCGAATIGVFYERPPSENRTASAGWYNTAAFERLAAEEQLYVKSINGDAFSNEIKAEVIDTIKKDLGHVDMVIYSLASPRRLDPFTCETYNSVIKTIGKAHTEKTVDFHTGVVSEATIEPATDIEIQQTIKVMGGEDWELWIDALNEAGILAEGAISIAYSYVGPPITHTIYRDGTIGKAKDHLEATALKLTDKLSKINGKAYVSINKALVTQASSAIPIVSLYVSILYKIMKEKGIHEDCIEQIHRLFNDKLYSGRLTTDEKNRIRIDDLEMRDDVQKEVMKIWDKINSENINDISDIDGFRRGFFNLFGFDVDGVDYNKDVDIEIEIPGII